MLFRLGVFVLCFALLPLTTQALSVNPCSIIADQGSFAYQECTEFLRQKNEVAAEDLRVRALGQRTNNLLTRVDSLVERTTHTADDLDWLERIKPAAADIKAQLATAMTNRRLILTQARIIDIAGSDIPESIRDMVLPNIPELEQALENWVQIEGDVDVLIAAIDNAIAKLNEEGLASTAGLPADAEVSPDVETPPESQANQPADVDIESAAVRQRNLMNTIEAACSNTEDDVSRNACIFQEAWMNLQVAEFCDGGNTERCDAAADLYGSLYTDEEWLQLMDEYGALDDPYAGIAVLICQITPPAIREGGEPVPLATCAQVEYLALSPAADQPVEQSSSDQPVEQSSSDENFIRPLPGIWCYERNEFCVDLTAVIFNIDETGVMSGVGFVPRIGENRYALYDILAYDNITVDYVLEIISPTHMVETTITSYDEETRVANLYHMDGN